MEKKLFINASKKYSWEEDFNEKYPYTLSIGEYENSSPSLWCVGTTTVEVPMPERNHIVACQVHGLEKAIEAKKAQNYKELSNLEQQLEELMCIGHEEALED